MELNVLGKDTVTDMDWLAAAGISPGLEGQVSSATRISSIKPRDNYSPAWEALILRTGRCDVMAAPRLIERVGGVCVARRAARGLSWPFFLSAAWPLAVLKPRIKGHRKLPRLILAWHVDGPGRPPSAPSSPRPSGSDRSGHTGFWRHAGQGHGEASACGHVVR